MILQSLYDYQKRKNALGRGQQFGCADEELKFLVEIDADGSFVQLSDMREEIKSKGKTGKSTLRGHVYRLPLAEQRSGTKAFEKPSLLWDSIDFVLGRAKSDAAKDVDVARKKLRNFSVRVSKAAQALAGTPAERSARAVCAFYERGEYEKVKDDPLWAACTAIPGCKMSFRVEGDDDPVAALPEVLKLAERSASGGGTEGICLITGEKAPLAVLHPQTPIRGGQAIGKLVSFQVNSGYDSYHKEKGMNAPVSQEAAFMYGTALNSLKDSDQSSFLLAGDTYVFWSLPQEKRPQPSPSDSLDFDAVFRAAIFGVSRVDDPDRGAERVKAYFSGLTQGKDVLDDDDDVFCLLGLSPNAARISVRLWKRGTIRDFRKNLVQHINDCRLKEGQPRGYFTLTEYLLSLVPRGERLDKLPPSCAGTLLASVISGGRASYPMQLYQRAIGRVRTEGNVDPVRAALIKGCLVRWSRIGMYGLGKENFEVAYDPQNKNVGYVLGSLFAVLEKIQSDAMPNVNAKLGERFYGAASSSPAAIFPQLLRMKQYYMKQLSQGSQIYYEQEIGRIMDNMGGQLPPRLDLIRQGAFALGYYHKRQKLYEKKTTDAKTNRAKGQEQMTLVDFEEE